MTDVTRITFLLWHGKWRLSFYGGSKRLYDETFWTLDAAFYFAPRIYRDRFGDDTRPTEEYYNEHTTIPDRDL